MSILADVQTFVRAVRDAPDLGSISTLMDDAAREFGFDHYGLTHVERTGVNAPPVYLSNFPADWLDAVANSQLYVHDPVLVASERSARAFEWEDVPAILRRLTPKQKNYMEAAKRAGLAEGFTVPLHIPGEASGVCSFVTRGTRPLPKASLPAAQYVSCFAFEAVRGLVVASPAVSVPTASDLPRLTTRQLDCLILVARGKTDWVAGQLLGLSPETVRMHIDNAKERFGVTSRAQLMIRALFYGQLSFADAMAH
ncbi:LuxR family transcriptional regulator [Sphingoaurantiacus capsulatus]|uniref:LuxR family transcriptional regulator n=1 Tax=Sphingoaurantiacus capsulatus TaxID=1771310 RepID=A0ABV7XHQ9_9SPHN